MATRRMKLSFGLRKPVLACGADLKGAFALAGGKDVFIYEGFGDLSDLGNLQRYEKAIAKAVKTTGMHPAIVVHDMHPEYFSTRFALSYAESAKRCAAYAVQHHEAHIASAMEENGIKGRVIGIAFDGTGYGTDGNIWGGEFFTGAPGGFKRLAHLEYVAMPGSDAAVRQPWRMAESYIYAASGKCKDPIIKKMIDRNINSPLTSSAGRLFDAAASIVLGKRRSDFEAELPMMLEDMAAPECEERYKYIVAPGPCAIISLAPSFKGLMADIDRGIGRSVISAKFHNTVSHMIAKVAGVLGKRTSSGKAVLSGGVFQNRYLTEKAIKYMGRSGLKVYVHKNLSTTDSGIPLGQIAIVNARRLCA